MSAFLDAACNIKGNEPEILKHKLVLGGVGSGCLKNMLMMYFLVVISRLVMQLVLLRRRMMRIDEPERDDADIFWKIVYGIKIRVDPLDVMGIVHYLYCNHFKSSTTAETAKDVPRRCTEGRIKFHFKTARNEGFFSAVQGVYPNMGSEKYPVIFTDSGIEPEILIPKVNPSNHHTICDIQKRCIEDANPGSQLSKSTDLTTSLYTTH
uniref:Uncharacterized protein n=1 Tax=Strigamia maritima TaxID=126957 RepID=T1IMU3_STRMM